MWGVDMNCFQDLSMESKTQQLLTHLHLIWFNTIYFRVLCYACKHQYSDKLSEDVYVHARCNELVTAWKKSSKNLICDTIIKLNQIVCSSLFTIWTFLSSSKHFFGRVVMGNYSFPTEIGSSFLDSSLFLVLII